MLSRRNRRVALTAALLCTSLAPSLSKADPAPPNVTAQHAFVGDPLWHMGGTYGALFKKNADQTTAMASTTKTMTLRLALLAVQQNLVHMDDIITISATAAGVGGSTMADINGKPLVKGEKVAFKDLLRGMMYPSGNNAAWAIAETVMHALDGPQSGVPEFVQLMNNTAAQDGLTHTHFTSPNGFDSGNSNPGTHYTTARELARLWELGMESDPRFQEITGFQGTYTFTTKAPGNVTKFYSYGWGGQAQNNPGWEGEKGGATPRCNGNAAGCLAVSSKRLNRRVVATFMQGNFNTDRSALLNWGFQKMFLPDLRKDGIEPRGLAAHALSCRTDGESITATLGNEATPTLATWKIDPGSASILKLAESAPVLSNGPPSGLPVGRRVAHEVKLTRLSDAQIITATRIGTVVELQHYFIPRTGANANVPELLESGVSAGDATAVELVTIDASAWAVILTRPDGTLEVSTWHFGVTREGNGAGLDGITGLGERPHMVKVASETEHARAWNQVGAAAGSRPDLRGLLHILTVMHSTTDTATSKAGWLVDPVTLIVTAGPKTMMIGTHALPKVRLQPQPADPETLFPTDYFAIATIAAGKLHLEFEYIDAFGTMDGAGASQNTQVPATEADLAGFADSGLFTLARSPNGKLQATVFDVQPAGSPGLQALLVSVHLDTNRGDQVEVCQLPSGVAAAGMFASVTAKGALLHLQGWRLAPTPYSNQALLLANAAQRSQMLTAEEDADEAAAAADSAKASSEAVSDGADAKAAEADAADEDAQDE